MVKLFVCRLCLLINFIFLFNSENISFYHCAVKIEIDFKPFLFLILLFSLFEPLLWTVRPCYFFINSFALFFFQYVLSNYPSSSVPLSLAPSCSKSNLFGVQMKINCWASNQPISVASRNL